MAGTTFRSLAPSHTCEYGSEVQPHCMYRAEPPGPVRRTAHSSSSVELPDHVLCSSPRFCPSSDRQAPMHLPHRQFIGPIETDRSIYDGDLSRVERQRYYIFVNTLDSQVSIEVRKGDLGHPGWN